MCWQNGQRTLLSFHPGSINPAKGNQYHKPAFPSRTLSAAPFRQAKEEPGVSAPFPEPESFLSPIGKGEGEDRPQDFRRILESREI